ncbi:uncharacterized protein [Euphorbia lathyris]|uniref:uncharacterized protein n=1 Tax=Euphorbia lathyris TaxID=212925 RepID=UPI00331410A9
MKNLNFPAEKMGLDSVSNPYPYPSTPPRLLTPPPSSVPITPQKSRDRDECFKCRELGHWSYDCPNKSPKKSPSSSPGSSTNVTDFPVVRCPCDRGACVVFTSSTDKNPKRKFYTCPVEKSKECGFFKWCDEIKGTPVCACGVGTCSLNRTSSGPDEGKWYYACRIKKNHGACDFFQWADYQVNSTLKWKRKGYPCCQTDNNEELDSNKQINALQSHQEDVVPNPTGNQLEVVAETESHCLRPDVGITINEGIIDADEDMSGIEGSSPTQTQTPFGGFLPEPFCKKQDNDALSKSIFKKLARSLFDIFESMSPLDPDQMLKVAEAIFISFSTLSIECRPFVEAVKDYIHNVSKLTAIEGSMHNRLSSQKLISLCENEKARFNNNSCLHKEALAAYKESEHHRRSLEEEILHLKGMLIRVEEQFLCCEAETSAHKARSDEACKDMLESEKSVQAVAFDLAEAIALERQKELVSNAARAAFEAAKLWLEE